MNRSSALLPMMAILMVFSACSAPSVPPRTAADSAAFAAAAARARLETEAFCASAKTTEALGACTNMRSLVAKLDQCQQTSAPAGHQFKNDRTVIRVAQGFRQAGPKSDAEPAAAPADPCDSLLHDYQEQLARYQAAGGGAPASSPAAPAAPTVPPAATPTVATSAFIAASPQPAAYAFVIGIDRYRDVPAATGARADAESFARLARQTLGLKDDHVRLAIEDRATRSDIVSGLKWLKDNVSAGGRVYFFFSGHGAPATDQSTYLVPYDGNPKDLSGSAVAVADVMKALGDTQAKEVLAIVDSCFSGAGGRSVLPPGARPLMRVKEAAPSAQLALFTASQGDEISGPAPGEPVGVFTKFVTQGLGTGQADANGDGQVSLQELSDWVAPRVARDAKKDNRDQHPKLVLGSGVANAANFIVEYGLPTK